MAQYHGVDESQEKSRSKVCQPRPTVWEGEGRLQNPSGWHCVPPDWYHQPSSSGQCYRLPEERVNGCVWCSVGVVSSRARLTDGAWGGWGDGRKGEGCQARNEELVVLSGKATAGDASGAGKKHVAPALPLGPFWHRCSLPPNPWRTDAWQPIPRGCGLG